MKSQSLLSISKVAARLPAQDLDRARAFYSEKFGLDPIEERPGGLRYRCGSGYFSIFESAGVASGTHTQMAWEVVLSVRIADGEHLSNHYAVF